VDRAGRLDGTGLPARRQVPFGLHQGVDYLLALFLGELALHTRSDTQRDLLVLGGVLVVVAAASDGPLSLVKTIPLWAHRLVDVLVMAGLVVLPVAVSRGRSPTSAVLGVVVAVLLGRLVLATRYAPAPPRRTLDADRIVRQGSRSLGRMAGRWARRRPG
jgi:hypothetical protein